MIDKLGWTVAASKTSCHKENDIPKIRNLWARNILVFVEKCKVNLNKHEF